MDPKQNIPTRSIIEQGAQIIEWEAQRRSAEHSLKALAQLTAEVEQTQERS